MTERENAKCHDSHCRFVARNEYVWMDVNGQFYLLRSGFRERVAFSSIRFTTKMALANAHSHGE